MRTWSVEDCGCDGDHQNPYTGCGLDAWTTVWCEVCDRDFPEYLGHNHDEEGGE